MYEVTLDFHDDALTSTKEFDNFTDLSLYLERVPSMTGFQLTDSVDIKVRVVDVHRKANPSLIPFLHN